MLSYLENSKTSAYRIYTMSCKYLIILVFCLGLHLNEIVNFRFTCGKYKHDYAIFAIYKSDNIVVVTNVLNR